VGRSNGLKQGYDQVEGIFFNDRFDLLMILGGQPGCMLNKILADLKFGN